VIDLARAEASSQRLSWVSESASVVLPVHEDPPISSTVQSGLDLVITPARLFDCPIGARAPLTIPTMTIDGYFCVEGEAREEYLSSLNAEALLQLGIDLYNAGYYWNAHEAWEEVWLESERGVRDFYQGLIQVTAAFVHVTRNEFPGSVRLLDSGLEKLERYPGDYMGVDVASLVQGGRAAYSRLAEVGPSRLGEFDRGLIPRIERAGIREG
jgi:hypothetical protein